MVPMDKKVTNTAYNESFLICSLIYRLPMAHRHLNDIQLFFHCFSDILLKFGGTLFEFSPRPSLKEELKNDQSGILTNCCLKTQFLSVMPGRPFFGYLFSIRFVTLV